MKRQVFDHSRVCFDGLPEACLKVGTRESKTRKCPGTTAGISP